MIYKSALLILLTYLTLFAVFTRASDEAIRQSAVRIVSGVPQHELATIRGDWPTGPLPSGSAKGSPRVRPDCDVAAKSGICVANGRRVIVPDAVPAGIVGVYTFNERLGNRIVDRSGHRNHGFLGSQPFGEKKESNSATAKFEAGPDRTGGSGASMAINGISYLHIPTSNTTEAMAKDFTAMFWIYLAGSEVETSKAAQAAGRGCPLFSIEGNNLSLLPTRQLSLEIKDRPSVTAQASLRPGAWTHLALSFNALRHTFSLYVNGIPDLHLSTSLETGMGVNIYLGGAPQSQCTTLHAFMDDVKLSQETLSPEQIAAEAFGALGGTEPTFTRIGCSRTVPCSWEQARVACPVGYHLCSNRELYTGGYQIARSLGWVTWNDAIWTSEDAAFVHSPNDRKVALCCAF